MDLGDTGTSYCCSFHDTSVTLCVCAVEAYTKDFLDVFSKIFPDDLPHVLPRVLRGVVKHGGKHLLKLGRQDGTLHGDGLANLEVKTAIVAKKVEEALSTTVVDVGEGRVCAEVDLVVEGNDETSLECAGGACNDGIEEVAVDSQNSGGQDAQLDQSLEEGSRSAVLLCCDRLS
jgi:3-deoxy-D-arabino-heptulosonate 7-phosphate (DAHP) synthase class II